MYKQSSKYYDKGAKVHFSDFDHLTIWREEIKYKIRVHENGRNALSLKNWSRWRKKDLGEIINNVKSACHKSDNLLEHRFGDLKSSERVLYKFRGQTKTRELAEHLYDFFKGKADLSVRFDSLIGYFEENGLNPSWAFVSYLAFLSDENYKYLPIRDDWIQKLFNIYGTDKKLAKKKSWQEYRLILTLADIVDKELKKKHYHPRNPIDVHSYMWVVARHFKDPLPSDFDFDSHQEFPPQYEEEIVEEEERKIQPEIDVLSDDEVDNKLQEFEAGSTPVEEKEKVGKTYGNKYKRRALLSAMMKRKYHYTCQICGINTFEDKRGYNYTETHHILPRGREGPDKPSNTVVVCPTCHRKFDKGNAKTLIEVYKLLKQKGLFSDFESLKDKRIISETIFNQIVS